MSRAAVIIMCIVILSKTMGVQLGAREKSSLSLCVLAGDEREEKNEKYTNHTTQSNIITRLLWKTHTHTIGVKLLFVEKFVMLEQ